MSSFKDYSLEEFAAAASFQEWVLNPTPTNAFYWKTFLHEYPQKEAEVSQARLMVLSLRFRQAEWEPVRRQRVWYRVDEATNDVPVFNRTSRRLWYQVAAVFLGFLLVGGALYRWTSTDALQQVSTQYGQTQAVQLPDGSTAFLNAHSSLRYAQNWQPGTIREVWLEGEGFFSVKKLTHKTALGVQPTRFIVHTDQVAVEVLGTKFNVNTRRAATQVVLSEGKIKLNIDTIKNQQGLVLMPGDMVEISGEAKQAVRRRVNPEVYSSWKNSRWLLANTPLAEVGKRIEETYGIRVIINDEATARRKVTGSFPSNNIDMLLRSLSTTLDIEVDQVDQQIRFKP